MPTDDTMLAELDRAVKQAREGGDEGDLRVDPVRLVFDDRSTDYDDPFLRSKTSKRAKYDDARERQGATLQSYPDPSAPPFDVILFNRAGEVTETTISNIAFRFSGNSATPFITPVSACGILEGVQRAELLEKGEVVEGVVKVEEVKRAVEAGTLEIICFNGVRGVFKAYIAREGLQ
ncbi:hypothetical protein JCM10213v2_000323 [Rhodosporidiobolus nylandii]